VQVVQMEVPLRLAEQQRLMEAAAEGAVLEQMARLVMEPGALVVLLLTQQTLIL